VLLAAVAHRAAVRVFRERPDILVVTTEVTLREVHEYIPEFARRYELDVDVLHEIANNLPVRRYTERSYRSHIEEARRYLAQRDPDDVALGALALKLNVPVWSNDNDLRELPLPVYSTAALLRALGM
jgi:predicted nucleic acid-binding protein